MTIRLFILLSLMLSSSAAEDIPSITQIIEVRPDRNKAPSVWGLRVNLMQMQLKDLDSLALVTVHDTKHAADITKLFQISMTRDRSTIVIRFHDNTGDFGTGNGAIVRIPANAFIEPFNKGPLQLEIETDLPQTGK